jgi:general secretion pathway protein D
MSPPRKSRSSADQDQRSRREIRSLAARLRGPWSRQWPGLLLLALLTASAFQSCLGRSALAETPRAASRKRVRRVPRHTVAAVTPSPGSRAEATAKLAASLAPASAAGAVSGAGAGPAITDFRCQTISPSTLVDVKLKPQSELTDLVGWIMGITCRHFIVSERVRAGKVTLLTPKAITAHEAYLAFLSALESMGLTVQAGGGRSLKIVEKERAREGAVPTFGPDEEAPRDDRVITRLFTLRHVSADDMSQVLSRLKGKDADVTPYAPNNTLIVTDVAASIGRMQKLIEELDVEAGGERMWVARVHHTLPSDLAERMLSILERPMATRSPTTPVSGRGGPTAAGAAGSHAAAGLAPAGIVTGGAFGESRLTRIVPDDRTQQLIIVANESAYHRVFALMKVLDRPLESGSGRIQVLRLENTNAKDLAQTLQPILAGTGTGVSGAGPGGGASGTSGSGPGGAAGLRPASAGGGYGAGGAAGAGRAGTTTRARPIQLFDGEVRVNPDELSNSLVVVASPTDFLLLKEVVRKLDVPRRQVFVEAVIMEVSVDKNRSFGVVGHGGNLLGAAGNALLFGGTNLNGLNSVAIDPTALQGLAVGLKGPDIPGTQGILGTGAIPAFGVLMQALQQSSDVNVLSTPRLLTTDNVEATIIVGQTIPFQGAFTYGSGTTGSTLNPVVSVQRQDVALKLTVKPHINESEQIRLELKQEIQDVVSQGNLGPTTSKRSAETQVTVRDQESVVIGGLVADRTSRTVNKVPFLGDIPVLGWLFKSEQKEVRKTNLLIVLTAYIIRDMSDFRRIYEKRMEEHRHFIESQTRFAFEDVAAEIDYGRRRGLLAEIDHTVREMEAEARTRGEELVRRTREPELARPLEVRPTARPGPVAPVAPTGPVAPPAPRAAPATATRATN